MKFLIPLSFVGIFFFSCNTNKNTPNSSDASFDIVIESAYGGKEEKSYEVIKSKYDLENETKNMIFDDIIHYFSTFRIKTYGRIRHSS